MTDVKITAAIPLYNKEREIGDAIRSVLAQTYQPVEIIVVNDGSTDAGPAIVRGFGSPLVRVIDQPNAGVSVARNRAAQEAEGDYIAFLDGDDRWRPEYLAAMAEMISRHPGCGAYAAAFDIVSGDRTYPNDSPSEDGPLEDFFCTALSRYVCQPSATVIPREVMTATGGFPAGMKLGEDLWLWIRIASEYPVCFTSRKLVEYNRTASNRSTGIYTPEKTPFSFDELVRPDEGASCRNEYIARSAIYKAITLSAKGDTVYGRRAAETFSYTRRFRRALLRLRLLNVLPVRLRASLNTIYDNLAWRLAKKGF